MDCSLWPFINFFGFAFIPCTLQPTYMACVSYFWQLYISGMASTSNDANHEHLLDIFHEIDIDQVCFPHLSFPPFFSLDVSRIMF